MALDGIAVKNIVFELKEQLTGGRIDKIYQPRGDEIIMSVRAMGTNYRLLLSANPSHPRAQLTPVFKDNPMTPPMFCMVLRKHMAGSKILDITQPNFERIIIIETESYNELGDLTTKKILIEIMGKHSNIILLDEKDTIIDSIKHISHSTSSVREVLPGKAYVYPPSQNKANPLLADRAGFMAVLEEKKDLEIQKAIYQSFSGISPAMASEICFRAGADWSAHPAELSQEGREKLFESFDSLFEDIRNNKFSPEIIYDPSGKITDFFPLETRQYNGYGKKQYPSISMLLEDFYKQRDNTYHIKQKAYDMRRLVQSNIERCVKKKEIQLRTRRDNKNMDQWKLKGELITANIYSVEPGTNTLKVVNYYDENMGEIEIALDSTLTPSENAQKYFNKYNKAKRTLAALETQEKLNDEELAYLESVLTSIDSATEENDLKEIRRELVEQGFIKAKKGDRDQKNKSTKKPKPLHFISGDGYDIYVGKNNVQNDDLTLHFAKPWDIWFHTKNIPGSHVIVTVRDENDTVPDATLLEAANLAAYHSKAKNSSSVPVDYCPRKNVKKPNGAKPGMVIYTGNRTVYVTPDEQKTMKMAQK